MKHIINVVNQIPVNFDQGINKMSNGLSTILDSVQDQYDMWSVGWTGLPAPDYQEHQRLLQELKSKHRYIPIFLEEDEIEGYFNGFSNSSLWPLLHYLSSISHYEEQWYEYYHKVNERYANAILEHARDGDAIWIHGHYFMLLPALLKKQRPELEVGFFFHTPFPSYELFRCHPKREELVAGVLGADLIGFQTFGYMRHFRSTVLRVLGLESEINIIKYKGYKTKLDVYPVGVNWQLINEIKGSAAYHQSLKEFKNTFNNKKLVLSIDQFDFSKGLLNKLMSIEKYLKDNPKERDTVKFIMLVVPSWEEINEYVHLVHDVEHAVGRINGQYSSINNIPIHFLNNRFSFSQICALYSLADVALITPLVDGMNLIAKEYIAVNLEEEGALILSEFAGASQELFNAHTVNPYNINQVADAIYSALHMTSKERKDTLLTMEDRIRNNDAIYWAKSFLQDLEKRTKETETGSIKRLNSGIAKKFRNKEIKKALFLDYDGTLREFVDIPSKAVPSENLIDILNKFNERSDFDVHIISGRGTDFLDKHFSHYEFTLIGEHGYFLKSPHSKWKTLIGKVDMSWKEEIIDIFQLYSLSTPGSSVEEKNSAIVWHYRRSDPEFGAWKATELIGDLTEAISNLPVEIHHGRKIVEVTSQHVNKGLAMASFLNEKTYDLVLCAGDDKTDERMFFSNDESIISVKIGDGETQANYRISTPHQFRKFLLSILNGN